MEKSEQIQAIADRVEKYSYMRHFTAEEMETMRVDLAEKSIELKGYTEELKKVQDSYKAKMKPIQTQVGKLLNNLHMKAESITEECFVELDQEKGVAVFYSKSGYEVGSRPLYASERQTTIFTAMRKEGTNN